MNSCTVHIFSGRFASIEAARSYCERDWGQAPAECDAPEVWDAWESKFPRWALQDDLDAYLDEDFIELSFGPERLEALRSLGLSEEDQRHIVRAIEADDTLLIIDELALGGFETALESTSSLRFLGSFRGKWI